MKHQKNNNYHNEMVTLAGDNKKDDYFIPYIRVKTNRFFF